MRVMHRKWALSFLILTASPCLRAADEASSSQDAPASALVVPGPGGPPATLPRIVVVGVTPVPGSDLDRDRVAESTRVLGPEDINRTGIPSLTGAILDNVSSATINDTEGNVFQPDILFRGFTASPVAGTPEGIAVFVNGARFNDAFGDTVNWDLIPPSAIESVNLEAANPVFGLNALGGSLSIRLKNGFDTPTQSVTAYGGSYGRGSGIYEFSRQYGAFAVYAVGDITHDDGFRQTSASDLYRLYTDLGWRSDPGELHLGVSAAHDTLGNPGATPEQALNANIANIFTAPNVVDNTYLGFNLNGSLELAASASLQGVAYFQTLNQVVPNGITEEVAPCGAGNALLCNSDGSVVTGVNGTPVTNFLDGATYSGLSVQQLTTHAYGASAQGTETAALGGLPNDLVGGASFDGSSSVFAGVQEIGGFDPYSREFLYPGVIQDQPSEGVNPVRVHSTTRFYGVFLTDVLTVAPDLDLTLGGRYNDAEIVLEDELGGPVNGRHSFARFNPSAGLTYRAAPQLQFYGNYSQTNRAPTPEELSCASAASPCSLLNFFVGDPNLNQVVAHTYELGIRGHTAEPADRRLSWNLDVYHTLSTNDIIYETTVYNPNLAFYTNAGRTLRRGAEASVRYDRQRLHVNLGYTLTDATFQTPLLLNTSSPAADANGNEQVLPGDRIPGIPKHRANFVVDYALTERISAGGSVAAQSNAYRFGDEANLTAPLGGYTVVDLNAAYRPRDGVTLFAVLNNAFDKRYYTYGSFGPVGDVPWPNVPGGVTDPRTASPGTPITVYGGMRINF
jgi:outer membrane receptor protein involved in Fe transport